MLEHGTRSNVVASLALPPSSTSLANGVLKDSDASTRVMERGWAAGMQGWHTPTALDLLRGLVCLQIVIMHGYVGHPYEALNASLGEGFSWSVRQLRFGYETFFLIAGYFLAKSFRPGDWTYVSFSGYIRRRLIRLAVPYWIALAFGIAWYELSSRLSGRAYAFPSLQELLPLLTFLHDVIPTRLPSVAYWFMAPLMQFYVLWGLLFWSIRRWFVSQDADSALLKANEAMLTFNLLIFVGSLAIVANGWQPQWRLLDNAVFLTLGCLTYWRTLWPTRRPVALACVAIILVTGGVVESPRLVRAGVASLIIPGVAAWQLPRTPLMSALSLPGVCSYSIYLTHTYLLYRVLNVPDALGWRMTAPLAAGVLTFGIVLCVLLGWIFHMLVERPLARASRAVAFRGAPRQHALDST